MVAVPADTPETTPAELTEAVSVLLLLHEPPVVPSLKEVVKPTHTLVVPPIAAGNGLTINVAVL